MTEKIEWYKEVLELEPASKLFFPLARLLVEDHKPEEAILVLERGLERHEEYLEARLYLIELLHSYGHPEACARQVSALQSMFSTYAGFWKAWAACLENVGAHHDAADVLRFLALHLTQGGVSLHDVFMRGLAAYSTDEEKRQDALVEKTVSPQQPVPSSSSPEVSSQQAREETALPQAEPLSAAGFDPVALVPETVEMPPCAGAVPLGGGQERGADAVVEGERADSFPGVQADAVAVAARESSSAENAAVASPVDSFSDELDVLATTVGEGEEERFSLRTRSMAEVLADQGDIRGALDIYHELAASSEEPQENADLCQRIETLSAQLDSVPPAGATALEEARGKERLISLLESLAERVEARAQM